MDYREYRPSPDLAPFVDRYWSLSGVTPHLEPVLPDGHVELIVHLGSPPEQACAGGVFRRQSATLIVGQQVAPVRLRSAGPVHVWGVRFQPAGARALLPDESHHLCGLLADAESALGSAPRTLREHLGNAGSATECVQGIERCLRAQLHVPPDPRLQCAVTLLSCPTAAPIVAVAETIGWSRRQLERAFAAGVGLSPRTFARISRFQFGLRLKQQHPRRTWAEVAAEAGFADQSHLVSEFRRFGGVAPQFLVSEVDGLTAAMLRG